MKKVFVEEGMYVSCTFDKIGVPQKLRVVRDKPTTKRKNGQYMLTVVDNKLEKEFTCKQPIKEANEVLGLVSGVGVAGGLGVGLGLISISPLGLIAFGTASLYAIFNSTHAGYIATHQCNNCLISPWISVHETLKIDKKKAILCHYSKLNCPKGGVLIASDSFEKAKAISEAIRDGNYKELSTDLLSHFFGGAISGPAIGAVGLATEIGLQVTDKMITSDYVTNVIGETTSHVASDMLTIAASAADPVLPKTMSDLKAYPITKEIIKQDIADRANWGKSAIMKDIKQGISKGVVSVTIKHASNTVEKHFSEKNKKLLDDTIAQKDTPNSNIFAVSSYKGKK